LKDQATQAFLTMNSITTNGGHAKTTSLEVVTRATSTHFQRSVPEEACGSSPVNSLVPNDLREWLDPRDLMRLILEAVQTLHWSDDDRHDSESADSFSQLALGLLAYCYATDLYSTIDITRRLSADCALHFLCQNRRFHPHQLRLVRSHNRELLHRCLSCVLRCAWVIRCHGTVHTKTSESFDRALRKHFDAEARARIDRAIEADPGLHANV
jgi:hypothetical protein